MKKLIFGTIFLLASLARLTAADALALLVYTEPVNKQDDIIVHPARGNQSGTIINGLAWHFMNCGSGTLSDVGREKARPGVVHRLDRHTTGVMVAAKSDTAHWKLGRQFEERTTRKRYLALVHGRVEPNADVIDQPIGSHPTQRQRFRAQPGAHDVVTRSGSGGRTRRPKEASGSRSGAWTNATIR